MCSPVVERDRQQIITILTRVRIKTGAEAKDRVLHLEETRKASAGWSPASVLGPGTGWEGWGGVVIFIW